MFAKVSEFKKEGNPLEYVNERFEYFHHYWTLLFLTKIKDGDKSSQVLLKPNYLLIEEDRLESHRSLFIKINKQLAHNYSESKKKLEYLFVEHPYFSRSNIIIRKYPGLAEKVARVKQEIEKASGNDFKKSNSEVKSYICTAFQKLEMQLFRCYPYEKRLANQLNNILSVNRPLNDEVKTDIKFLVNSFVVELYQYGYSENYISKIPDIVLLREDDKYIQYEGEKEKMNLKTILNGLVKLIDSRKHKGYTIFKLDGITLDKNRELLGVEFYNPQTERKAKKHYEFINIDAELFTKEPSEKSTPPPEPSTCNAIVDTAFLRPFDRNGSQVLRAAYRKVETSSLLLSNILNKYADTTFGKISVTPERDKCLSLFDNDKIPTFSTEIFSHPNNSSTVEFLDDKNRKWVEEEIDFYNINSASQTGRRIVALIRQQKMLENNIVEFNFKDLWTAWEGVLKGGKIKELKCVCKHAVRIYLSTNFLPKVKRMLYRNLYADDFYRHFIQPSKYHLLKKSDIHSLGLYVPDTGIVTAKDFKRKYKDIISVVDFPLLREIIDRIDTFIEEKEEYYRKVDTWIDRTMDEVYAERNLEAHNNEETDLSRFKLQATFLDISAITINEVVRNINARNKNDIQKILKKIESKASKI